MAKEKPSVLVVDDEANILKTMTICLEEIGLNVTSCQRPQEALQRIVKQSFDLAFVDLKMRPIDGLKVLKEIKTFSPETTVVIITAHGSIESAVEAMKEGAFHYLQKPFDYLELQILAQKALEYHRLRKEVENYRAQLRQLTGTENIITRHKKMLENIQMAKRIAATDLSVLIEGESGTGKELFAQLIYQHSDRRDKPFIKINCAALPDNLLESELFGHVKGAFTGAIKDRKGRFELADGGTIFLDEIGELSPSLQAKLLRVLQQKEFERLGESKSRKVDVRIIAATNKNLEQAMAEGNFRKDLFYRLNTVRIKLPPLREQPEDIMLLVQYFLEQFSEGQKIELAPPVVKAFKSYRWSGNVRELENVIKRAIALAKTNTIELNDLPEEVRFALEKPVRPLSLEEMEKQHIKKVLQIAKDLNEAAEILGIDPATLWRKRKRYDL
ncbi:two component, sigma54 specific, transcriptional regulator, Fis family [Caldithrix abyssi DSM 13497]|uniref:Two component, sigma54 specific, transcriptional regulator, Fis family n=1 Tax=Caldithrix abyssi DSM 13497 TaxID=880073 RepID=H1XPZ1_CALAY|nr:sigma-54 dependent transcriptional regulator [Caldithrix abyssi]APF20351.1 two-component system, NtrC family, response regulator AlgB [Caldithrix abyssi DSM 13497]EHO41117.1 two component, sigma54 specific, transcriptional regulator, Fis family [Caldithrix abyssi DSM 13497]